MPSEYMQRALELAAMARHQTSPNPMVGAVLVRDSIVVGEGFHHRAGEPHAEVLATLAAGEQARGAVMYVTLEPCAFAGRTGACTSALLAAGVTRVVAAIEDPDARVNGRGFTMLRDAGVKVEVGDGAEEAEAVNRRYLLARRSRRPYLALKFGMSMDGKIATAAGESRWITSEQSRAEAHHLRQAYDAVAVGAMTVIDDDPTLTARDDAGNPAQRQPLRVVVDGRLRIDPGARVLDPELPGRALLATTSHALDDRGSDFHERGVWVQGFAGDASIDIGELLAFLAEQEIASLLIEGGGELGWSAVRSGAVDRVYAFVAPTLIGGRDAPTPVGGEGYARLADALRLELVGVRHFGPDVLIEAVTA
jgi:diaminohydroxyphosphoribosylaminopyrimidine deaminase/5-amino-6-(5-phosphoribosylamino)uracil reductase